MKTKEVSKPLPPHLEGTVLKWKPAPNGAKVKSYFITVSTAIGEEILSLHETPDCELDLAKVTATKPFEAGQKYSVTVIASNGELNSEPATQEIFYPDLSTATSVAKPEMKTPLATAPNCTLSGKKLMVTPSSGEVAYIIQVLTKDTDNSEELVGMSDEIAPVIQGGSLIVEDIFDKINFNGNAGHPKAVPYIIRVFAFNKDRAESKPKEFPTQTFTFGSPTEKPAETRPQEKPAMAAPATETASPSKVEPPVKDANGTEAPAPTEKSATPPMETKPQHLGFITELPDLFARIRGDLEKTPPSMTREYREMLWDMAHALANYTKLLAKQTSNEGIKALQNQASELTIKVSSLRAKHSQEMEDLKWRLAKINELIVKLGTDEGQHGKEFVVEFNAIMDDLKTKMENLVWEDLLPFMLRSKKLLVKVYAKEKAEIDAKAKIEADAKAKTEAEAKAKADADAKVKPEEKSVPAAPATETAPPKVQPPVKEAKGTEAPAPQETDPSSVPLVKEPESAKVTDAEKEKDERIAKLESDRQRLQADLTDVSRVFQTALSEAEKAKRESALNAQLAIDAKAEAEKLKVEAKTKADAEAKAKAQADAQKTAKKGPMDFWRKYRKNILWTLAVVAALATILSNWPKIKQAYGNWSSPVIVPPLNSAPTTNDVGSVTSLPNNLPTASNAPGAQALGVGLPSVQFTGNTGWSSFANSNSGNLNIGGNQFITYNSNYYAGSDRQQSGGNKNVRQTDPPTDTRPAVLPPGCHRKVTIELTVDEAANQTHRVVKGWIESGDYVVAHLPEGNDGWNMMCVVTPVANVNIWRDGRPYYVAPGQTYDPRTETTTVSEYSYILKPGATKAELVVTFSRYN